MASAWTFDGRERLNCDLVAKREECGKREDAVRRQYIIYHGQHLKCSQ